MGFYSKAKQCICIDEGLLEKPHLEPTLCHEFTHFLVMNDKSVPSGFINEAQTEMFTRQIYPISRSYEPQVRMMEFANILMNKANNFSLFFIVRFNLSPVIDEEIIFALILFIFSL